MCINLEQVCDNKNDCGDWKDEPRDNCDVNECLSDNGGCDQVGQDGVENEVTNKGDSKGLH